MSELSDFLAREVEAKGYREVEAQTGVSRGSLENLVKQENIEFPKLETLEKFALAYQLPLWRVIEMTGIDLGLSRDADELARQLTSLANRLPEIQPIVSSLLKLHPDDLRGVVAYLGTLDRQRDRGTAPDG